MPGARAGVDQVDRVIDLARDAIVDSTDRLLEANGTAVLTIYDASSAPRAELTCTARVVARADGVRPPPRQLAGEIGQLADDVRRALISNRERVDGARQIVIEIRLLGARPGFDISYRGHLT